MSELRGLRVHINGVVQGVGFRPFVYGLASRLDLLGWVRNTSAGVDIEVDGSAQALEVFVLRLRHEAPPLARIDEIEVKWRSPNGYATFEIVESEPIPNAFQPISPDVATCPDCLRELFDPHDRRYRYPFINCTNCGPRFTIIQDIPYDRPKTTMAGFPMCPDCLQEYGDPLDRRFHAQPVACPACGPQVWLEWSGSTDPLATGASALNLAQEMLAQGKILAIKGLGGFHLACDASNPSAVAELRRRKLRRDKPFAVMVAGLEVLQAHCELDETSRELLTSHARPIVLLKRRPAPADPDPVIAREVAPYQDNLGVMLPYTPLHHLLFNPSPEAEQAGVRPPQVLVMTSGNLSEEPIAIDNEEARRRLSNLADAFLMHDRSIQTRCDDSVMQVFSSADQPSIPLPLRRSRGYAPYPVRLPWEAPNLLAAGGELKNTFCITRERYAFLSHHIGDMENYETLQSFEKGIIHFERLFRIRPQALAYDLHPNYQASRYILARAAQEGLPAVGVQHHHAHIAACLAEHGYDQAEPVIGVAFDGTGFGDDGAIWGGEFLVSTYTGYQRLAHLAYAPLPGGDVAVLRPARVALAYLWQAGLDWEPDLAPAQALCVEERAALRSQIEHRINSPMTSSMGRLFDAASALAGVRQKVNYEAQAAIEFEAMLDPDEKGVYPFSVISLPDGSQGIDPAPLFEAMLVDLHNRIPVHMISARFHNGVAQMVLETCQMIRHRLGLNRIVLSGGVWQNLALFERANRLLQAADFNVMFHHLVPSNDGGLALGQAVVAIKQLATRTDTRS